MAPLPSLPTTPGTVIVGTIRGVPDQQAQRCDIVTGDLVSGVPEWLAVGQEVGLVNDGYIPTVHRTTVARHMKAYAVMANGDRYSLTTMIRHGDGGVYVPWRVMPIGERFFDVEARAKRRARIDKAHRAINRWERDETPETARAAAAAILATIPGEQS
jgi:hypothetical protein